MSYISKYLESLMTKKDAICDSQTTNSKYYTIGKAKIGFQKLQRLLVMLELLIL